jgi:hypothetical protein
VLKLAPSAEDALEEFGREMAARANEAAGTMAGALGKARGHALRLATVLEYLWWAGEYGGAEPNGIGERAVTAACALLDSYFLPMAERVYGDAAIPAQERHAMALVRHIRRGRLSSFNARRLRREAGGDLRESTIMDGACHALEEAGLIRPVQPKRPGVGRPSKDYIINPVVHGAAND